MQLAVQPSPDQRSVEILASVRQAFVEKGFDGASMQDLARAAGMSVGNFYRYFPSKSAIVQALIEFDLDDIQRVFHAILQSPHPMAALRAGMRQRIDGTINDHDPDLWTEIEAVARRSPEIRAAAQRMEQTVAAALISVFAAETGLPEEEATRRFSASATFIVVLFKAASCLHCSREVDQTELKSMIIRTIEQTLDDVTNSAQKA
jgi:AcrR family transcriptional regulator